MKKGILLTILLFLWMPIIVFASPTTEISGVENAKPGDIVAYDVKITVEDGTKAVEYEANIDYSSDILELRSVTGKDWEKVSGTSNLSFKHEEGIVGTSTIATITFKVKDNIPKQTTVISLKDIKITTLDELESKSITPITENSSHKVSLAIKSTDNTLKDIQLNNESIPDFKSDVFEYTLDVEADIDKIELKATVNNSNATFVDTFGNRTIDLNYGENEALLKVSAESGEIQVYKLIINRKDDRNTNNELKEVIINSGKIKLELIKNQIDYELKTYKLKELEVDAIAVDTKAKVDVKLPEEIIIGNNVVTITVTSEVGEERIYTITFENSDTEIDTKLKTLYISGLELDFDKNTMVYEVVYNKKFQKGLNIKVVPVSSSENVTYEILYNGKEIIEDTNIDLKVGDRYEIRVLPLGMEEGDYSESTTYTIVIVKDKRVNFFLLLEILIILILIILIIIQMVKRNKNKNKPTALKKTAKEEKLVNDQVVNQEIAKTKIMSKEELTKIEQANKK